MRIVRLHRKSHILLTKMRNLKNRKLNRKFTERDRDVALWQRGQWWYAVEQPTEPGGTLRDALAGGNPKNGRWLCYFHIMGKTQRYIHQPISRRQRHFAVMFPLVRIAGSCMALRSLQRGGK